MTKYNISNEIMISKILGIDDKMIKKFFSFKFIDPKIEQEFNKILFKKYLFFKISINLLYILMIIFNFFTSKIAGIPLFIYSNICLFILWLGLQILYYILRNSRWNKLIDIILSFTIVMIQSFNCLCYSIFLKTEFYEVYNLRRVYIMIIISNTEILYLLDYNLIVNSSFLLINLIVCISIISLKEENNRIYIEIIVVFFTIGIGSIFKGYSSLILRKNFIQKYKFRRYFTYCNDLINSRSGFQFSVNESKILFCNDKFKKHLISIVNDLNKSSSDILSENSKEINLENKINSFHKSNLSNELFNKKIQLRKFSNSFSIISNNFNLNKIFNEKKKFNSFLSEENIKNGCPSFYKKSTLTLNKLNNKINFNYFYGDLEKNVDKLDINLDHVRLNISDKEENSETINQKNKKILFKIKNLKKDNIDIEENSLIKIKENKNNLENDININSIKKLNNSESLRSFYFDKNKIINKEYEIKNRNYFEKEIMSSPKPIIVKNCINSKNKIKKKILNDEKKEKYIKSKPIKDKIIDNSTIISFIGDYMSKLIPLELEEKFINFKKDNLAQISQIISHEKNMDSNIYLQLPVNSNDLENIKGNNFILLGEFFSGLDSKIFKIYFRKIRLIENIVDYLLYDVTKIKMAEFVESKLKSKFFAKIAHEFKTPINIILGLLNQINNIINIELNIPKIKKILKKVENVSSLVIYLIQDVIDYSNFNDQYSNNLSYEQNKLQIKNSHDENKKNKLNNISTKIIKINLLEIINFSTDICESLLINREKDKNVLLYNEFNPLINSLLIKSDEFRIKQIHLNFLSNSVKFTKSGYIKIKSEILNDTEIIISVEDTGIGIKEKEKKFIFQDSIVLDTSKNYNTEGSRFGLSISKCLTTKLNHRIEFQSEYGKGSKFSIILKYEKESDNYNNSINEANSEKKIKPKNSNSFELNKIDFNNISNETIILKDSEIKFELEMKKSFENEISNNLFKIIKDKNQNKNNLNKSDDSFKNDNINYQEDNIKLKNINQENINFLSKKSVLNKILIVDDHLIIRDSLKKSCKRILNKYSMKEYDIIEGSDGVDIIYKIIKDQSENNLIKCIITDENMEYINGSEAIKIIRKLEKFNKIKFTPILSITAFEDIAMKELIIKNGADKLLSKPCNEKQLKEFFDKFNII